MSTQPPIGPPPGGAGRPASGAGAASASASPWSVVNPDTWAPPVGYANAVLARGSTFVALAGQVAFGPEGTIRHAGDLVAQATLAFQNVLTVLAAAGAQPAHMVRARIYVLDADAYAAHAPAIGRAWRATFGRWFPAMTLVQVARLYEKGALIEVEAEAILP